MYNIMKTILLNKTPVKVIEGELYYLEDKEQRPVNIIKEKFFYIGRDRFYYKKTLDLLTNGENYKLESKNKKEKMTKKVEKIKVKTLVCNEISKSYTKDYGKVEREFIFEPSTLVDLRNFVNNNDNISLDIETNTLLWYKPFAECLLVALYCHTTGETQLLSTQYVSNLVRFMNEAKNKNYIIHNAAFDIQFLMNYGLDHNNLFIKDTFLLTKLAENNSERGIKGYGLKDLLAERGITQDKLGASFSEQDQSKDNPKLNYTSLNENHYVYGVSDVLDLYSLQNDTLRNLNDTNTYMEEERFLHILLDMSRKGIFLDKESIPKAIDEAYEEIDKIVNSNELFKGFHNPTKVKQLFVSKGYQLDKSGKGNDSLTKKQLNNTIPSEMDDINLISNYGLFLKYKQTCEMLSKDRWWQYSYNAKTEIKIKSAGKTAYYKKDYDKYEKGLICLEEVKLKKQYQLLDEEGLKELKFKNLKSNFKRKGNTCVKLSDQLDEKGRVHPSIQQLGAHTGRMSMNNPNMQSFPKKYRELVSAPKGKKIQSIDFSGQEIYVAAILSNCDIMLNKYLTGDYHTENAKLLYKLVEGVDISHLDKKEVSKLTFKDTDIKQREIAKVIGLGVSYGMSPPAALKQLKLPPTYLKTVEKIVDTLITPKLREWQKINGTNFILTGGFSQGVQSKYSYHDNILQQKIKNLNSFNMYVDNKEIIELRNTNDYKYKDYDYIEINDVKTTIKPKLREFVNKIKNYPVQGTSAASLKFILNRLIPYIKENNQDIELIHLIHDEMVFEVDENITEETRELVLAKIVELSCEYFGREEKIKLEDKLEDYQTK